MKRIAAVCLTATVCLTAEAQKTPLTEASRYIGSLKKVEILSSEHEQGRDGIDSLYYCQTETAALPYKSNKDKATAKGCIERIVSAYRTEVQTASYGVAYNAQPETTAETKRIISIFYSEKHQPFKVGENDHRYVLIRRQDPQNPEYRRVYGMEWWIDTKQKRILFRNLDIFGPLRSRNENCLAGLLPNKPQINSIADIQKYFQTFPPSSQEALRRIMPELETMKEELSRRNATTDIDESMLEQIGLLAGMYKGTDNSTDRAVIRSINSRVAKILQHNQDKVDLRVRLFKTLTEIPGYGVEIIETVSEHKKTNKHTTFRELVSLYPTLDIFCMSWMDENDLYTKKQGKECRNGILQIVLN